MIYLSAKNGYRLYAGSMRYLAWLLVLLMLAPVYAQDPIPKAGDDYQVFTVDLDGDGKPEKVGLHCQKVTDSGWSSRLTVWRNGQVIWQSMPAKIGVWAFGGWDWGISGLELVADLDGDGKVEALVPEPVSDVSPVAFRLFRWDGKGFRHVQTKTLILQSAAKGQGPDRFVWSDAKEAPSWIGGFESGNVAKIWSDKGETRRAVVRSSKDGFKIVQWLK